LSQEQIFIAALYKLRLLRIAAGVAPLGRHCRRRCWRHAGRTPARRCGV